MTKSMKAELRLSEVVSPFGVGAIADIDGQSLMGMDTGWWGRGLPEVQCARLSDRLGGALLVEPPPASDSPYRHQKGPAVPYLRFPAWRYCERCGRLSSRTPVRKGSYANRCDCGGSLVPMRFVAVCETGSHIQDVPWFKWVHHRLNGEVTEPVSSCREYGKLKFIHSTRYGEGLKSLRIVCDGCGSERALDELTIKGSLRRAGIKCEGRQPWELEKHECESPLVAVQRGATGNYLAERVSALDIPEAVPESVALVRQIMNNPLYPKYMEASTEAAKTCLGNLLSVDVGIDPEELSALGLENAEEPSQVEIELKDEEWAAFGREMASGRRSEPEDSEDFVVDGWTGSDIDQIRVLTGGVVCGLGQVRRVREVRALVGFRRHRLDAKMIPADLTPGLRKKFPALETFGEGIFIQFDEARMAAWESDPHVRARVAPLSAAWAESDWARRLPAPEARFVALHTLAHLLIRRLSFESGYSSASLGERVYARTDGPDNMAGILIYTAAGDSAGTLGGLVRLGAPSTLGPILLSALADADTCSNDPVCWESDGQMVSALNLGACHGCAFVSETSCETGNRLLDRKLLLGTKSTPGFLSEVLAEARNSRSVWQDSAPVR